MLFNSLDFAVFLPVVFILYWLIPQQAIRQQNLCLLAASYIFYGWWDWRFLSLVVFSSFVDYYVGLALDKSEKHRTRKMLLLCSIAVNLGFLGFFKYYGFFAQSFADSFAMLGNQFEARSLNIVLPVGISFYTFQTLSYSIDVYRRRLAPTKDFVAFFSFVSFFPQLVAGPIERATSLLPQFTRPRSFDYSNACNGMRQILWGLFKKIVIADNCAKQVNLIFDNYETLPSGTLIIGLVLFSFQIYGDFSGYSDIAIGTSRLFGFTLNKNFAFPYFSRDIAEFWRRWHISLSTWFRDYVYIPLGGSRGSQLQTVRNILVVFVVSGLWHGANWTFVVWGLINACFFLPVILLNKNRTNIGEICPGRWLPTPRVVFQISLTFMVTTIAWAFFRSNSVGDALLYLQRISTMSPLIIDGVFPRRVFAFICLMLCIEWFHRNKEFGLDLNSTLSRPIRWGIYQFLCFSIYTFGGRSEDFIYFQF